MEKIITRLQKETGCECFDTFRRCLDRERTSLIEYDDVEREFMDKQGETVRHGKPQDVSKRAREWLENEPAFRLFLDGSRRTYKIADIAIGTQVFPIIAGQVGVGVCERNGRRLMAVKDGLRLHTVLAVPVKLDSDGKNEKQHRAFLTNSQKNCTPCQAAFVWMPCCFTQRRRTKILKIKESPVFRIT